MIMLSGGRIIKVFEGLSISLRVCREVKHKKTVNAW